MVDRLNGSNHFAADSLQKQVAKVSNRFSRFEEHLAQRKKIVEASVVAHTSVAEVCDGRVSEDFPFDAHRWQCRAAVFLLSIDGM